MAMWFSRRLDALDYHVRDLKEHPEEAKFDHLINKINRLKEKKPWELDQNMKDVRNILAALNHTSAKKKNHNDSSSGTLTPFSHYSGIVSIEAASENNSINKAFVVSVSGKDDNSRSQNSLLNQCVDEGMDSSVLKQSNVDADASLTKKEEALLKIYNEQHSSLSDGDSVKHVQLDDLLNATKNSKPDNSLSLDMLKEGGKKASELFNANMRMSNLKPNFGKSFSALLSPIAKENSRLEDKLKAAIPHEENNMNAPVLEDFGLMDGEIEKHMTEGFSEEAKIFDPEKFSIDLGDNDMLNKAINGSSYNLGKEKTSKGNNSIDKPGNNNSFSGLLNRVGDNLSMIDKNKDSMEFKENKEVHDTEDSLFENEQIKDLLVSITERASHQNLTAHEKNESLIEKLENKVEFCEELSKVEKYVGSSKNINQSFDKAGEENSKMIKSGESIKNFLKIINPEQPADTSKLDSSIGSLRRSVPKLDLSKIHESKKRIPSNPNNTSAGHIVIAEGPVVNTVKDNASMNLNEPFFPNGKLELSDDDDEAENKKTEKPTYNKVVNYFGTSGNPSTDDRPPLQPQSNFNKTPVKFNIRPNEEQVQHIGANTGKKSHLGHKSMDSSFSPIPQQVGFIRHAHSQRQGESVNAAPGSSQSNLLGGLNNTKEGGYSNYFPNLTVHQSQVMPRPPSLPRKRYHAKHNSSIEEPKAHDSIISFENSKLSVYKPELVKNKPIPSDSQGPSGDVEFHRNASKTKEIPTRGRSVSNHDSDFIVQGTHAHTKSLNMRQSHDVLNNYNTRTFHYSRGEGNDSHIEEMSRDNSLDKYNYKYYQYYGGDSSHKQERDEGITKFGTGKYTSSLRNVAQGINLGLNDSGRTPINSALSTSAINTVLSAKKNDNGFESLNFGGLELNEENKGVEVQSKNKSRTLPYQKTSNSSKDFERGVGGINLHDSSKENAWRFENDVSHGGDSSFVKEEKGKVRTKSSTVASTFAKIVSGTKVPLSQERVSARIPSTQATFTRNSQSRSPVIKAYSPMSKELTESKILQSTGNTSQIMNLSPEKDGARAMQANFRSKRFKDAKKA